MARAELIEALARMVNRVIQHGKAEAQSALWQHRGVRTTLAGVTNTRRFPRGPRRGGAGAALVSVDVNQHGGAAGIGGAGFGNLGHPSRGVWMRKSYFEPAAEFFDRSSVPKEIADLWDEWRELDPDTARLVRAAVSSRSPRQLRMVWHMLAARAELARAVR